MKSIKVAIVLLIASCSGYPPEIVCPMELKNGYLCEYVIDRGELDVLHVCPKCKTPIDEVLDMYKLSG